MYCMYIPTIGIALDLQWKPITAHHTRKLSPFLNTNIYEEFKKKSPLSPLSNKEKR